MFEGMYCHECGQNVGIVNDFRGPITNCTGFAPLAIGGSTQAVADGHTCGNAFNSYRVDFLSGIVDSALLFTTAFTVIPNQ